MYRKLHDWKLCNVVLSGSNTQVASKATRRPAATRLCRTTAQRMFYVDTSTDARPLLFETQLDKEYLSSRTKLPTENGGHCAKLRIVIKRPARPAIAHAIISRCVGTAGSLQNASTAIATAVAEPRIVVKSKSHAAIVSATTSKCAAMDASLPNASASTVAPSAK